MFFSTCLFFLCTENIVNSDPKAEGHKTKLPLNKMPIFMFNYTAAEFKYLHFEQ